MINISDSFINKIKLIFKEKSLSLSENVFCFVCGNIIEDQIPLDFIVVPLEVFENNEEKLPFNNHSFFKKNGCLMSCSTEAFFYLINKRLTISKDGQTTFIEVPSRGKNSYCWFIGECLMEHLVNEKLTKKELARNIGMTVNKLNKIFKGDTGDIGIDEMVRMSFEFQGKYKASTYFVLVEKYIDKKLKHEIEV